MNAPTADTVSAPASFAQQRLWFIDRLEAGAATYHIPLAVRLRGELDQAAAAAALGDTVGRHEALRTTFAEQGGEVAQIIHGALPPAWRVEAAEEAGLAARMAEEARRPFDLTRGPLLRAVCWRLGPRDQVLQLTLHHIVSDGWSLGVLMEEFAACYRARRQGGTAPLPELAIQYADYAAWQRGEMDAGAFARPLAYWRERLALPPEILALPADRARPPVLSDAGRTHRFAIGSDLTAGLQALSRHGGGSLHMTLLGAFAVLLRRLGGEEDIIVGSPVANRTRSELEPLIGFFVNTLALRIDLSGDPTVRQFLARVRGIAFDALAHQEAPFEQLVRELRPDRALDHTPLFQAMFVLQNAPVGPLSLPGLAAEPVEIETATAKFDLTLALEESAGGLIGRLEYRSELFEAATAERFARLYLRILEGFVASPSSPLADLDLLSAEEREQVLVGWKGSVRRYPGEEGLGRLFSAVARERGAAAAVVFEGTSLSYGQLEERSNRLARHLMGQGIRPGDLVGLCLERSLELIVGVLGIVKAGAGYVALAPEYPAARLALLRSEAELKRVVTTSGAAERLGGEGLVLLDRIEEELARESAAAPAVIVDGESPAYVSYTSGSTGRPKGVVVPQRAVIRLVRNSDFAEMGPEEVFLQLAPLAFDASTLEVWGPLLNGGRLVVAPARTPALEELGQLLREQQVTTLWLTAGLFHLMVDERLEDLAGLRQLLAGGDVLSAAHVRRVLKELPGVRLINGYGPTENTTFTCCHTLKEADLAGGSVPIGRPIANTSIYILDSRLQPVPVGVAGELYTGGDGLALGYLQQPDLTAEKFIANPFGPGRLYRTGDLVRWRADGVVEFLGRADQQVKLRGYRVEPGEVEAALLAEPGVRAAAVVVREEQGRKRLVGYAVGGTTAEKLRQGLQGRLPDYLVPSAIVLLERLPLTPNGKLDRHALPAPAPECGAGAGRPLTPAEEILSHLWSQLLGVGRPGPSDNFFALGGHSLLATQLATRIRQAFAVEFPLRAIFEAPTLERLAGRIEISRRESSVPAAPIVPVPRGDGLPLSFAQERLWFLNQLEPGNPFYNMPAGLRLRGAFDPAAAGRVLRELGRRHESLRTIFLSVDGRPVQRILPELPAPLAVTDLAGLPAAERRAAAERIGAEEARLPFDLARGPLWRARLLRLAPAEHLLLLTMHHIVSDGWSMGVLTREMSELYGAFAADGPSPLPALAVHYADFAVWQRAWLSGPVLARQLDYWTRQLDGAPPVLVLPTDRPRPAVQSFRGGSHAFLLGAELSAALARFSAAAGATLFMTLQAGFAALLSRLCNQEDVVVGTPIANRTRSELEPLIGFFVNTLVLRADLSGQPGFGELVARVRRTALDAYAHQDLPFERLVDELRPERDLSRNPIFQVMFALHNTPQGRRELPGLQVEDLAAERISAQFDLVLDIWETPEGLKAVLEYAADLFDPASIRRMAGQLRTLLAAALAAPDEPVARLALLPEEETRELLEGFNATAMPYPDDRALGSLIAEQARRSPERIAGIHRGGKLSYGELESRSNRLARRLRALGAGPGGFVGILDERGLDVLVAMVAILKSGAAFLPIDPAYPPERVLYMIANSGVATLLTRGEVLSRLDLAPAGGALRELVLFDDEPVAGRGRRTHPRADWEREPDGPMEERAGPADYAYLLYTSGSTGLPKGAVIRHNGAINHIYGQFRELAFHPGTAFLQSAPSSSDISVWQFLAPLLIGGRVVIADYETVCEPSRLFALIRDQAVTLIELVPVVLKGLLDHAALLEGAARALPRLEFAMVTGEAVPVALVNQWFATYPGIRLANAYGPTEAADDICQAVLDRPLPADLPSVPLGRTLPNLTLYVLDRHLQLAPIGVPGEICVSGVGVGAGYWRNEERTRAAFVPNPFAAGGRGEILYRTGDLGRWRPDGTLEMLGRLDQQVKLRGFRIELGEIESALARHPGVAEAAVLIREDPAGERRLAAYVTPNEGGESLREKVGALRGEQVDLWRDLHEDSYRDSLDYGDETFEVIGWDSNYTGQPLPPAEMREYVAHTAARVRELKARRILELGCGTGLLLFPLAPECDRYVGTDLSRVAIDRLERRRAARPELARVELRVQRADDFTGLAAGSFDAVMLCSVVQYFPGVEYLLEVLDRALAALVPGGAIFLGDIRLRPLLPAFHASVQLFKAEEGLDPAALRRHVRAALGREQELALDPSFFAALRSRFPAITRIEVRPKRGSLQNEMTRFRADVTLHTAPAPAAPALQWIEWGDRALGLAGLRRELASGGASPLALRGVANTRVLRELRTLAWLESAPAGETAGSFRAGLDAEEPAGLEPEDLLALGAQLGYDVQLAFALDAADGSFDAVFQPRREGGAAAPVDFFAAPAVRPWRAYGNDPLREKLARELGPALRGFLRERLPAHMVPSDFVVLESMPLLPNGKVDRRALPAPAAPGAGDEEDYAAPATPTEEKLAAIWSAVLGRERIGARANFFALGGHSLKATQVVSRIQRDLGVEVALREMFNRPTIAELAREIDGRRHSGHEPIPATPAAADHPLSHAQLRLWVLAQMEGVSAAYNMPAALLLEGEVDAAALAEAFADLARRHEALRTTFAAIGDRPRQRVHPGPLGSLGREDLSAETDPEARARDRAREDAGCPFDLERGPLLRACLLRLAATRHVLLFNIHHIVCDDWSLGVLVRELANRYAARRAGTGPGLPPLRLQYRDYAAWQNARLEAEAMAPHRDYWRERFRGEIPVLELGTDFPRPPIKTYRGRARPFALPAELAAELNALARRRECSLFMVLAAAVHALLHRLSGQRDLVVGFPIAGRDHPDLEEQVGFYVNTLPLRAEVDPDRPFTALLETVRTAATEAYEHQAYPFDRLVDDLALARDVARSPLFDAAVVMQNVDPYAVALAGAAVRPFLDEAEGSKFDLAFHFEEREGTLRGALVFNRDLFSEERAARMAAQLTTLLGSVAAEPGRPVGRLELLPPEERRRLRAAADPAPAVFPPGETLVTRFEAQVARGPERTALTLGGSGESLGYGELNAQANRLARRLRALGVGPETLVGLYLERSLELIVGLLAILKAGGAYLPLDPAYPPERISYILEDAGAPILIAGPGPAPECGATRVLRLATEAGALARESPENLPVAAAPGHAAYVIYTSGSTGRPKGCVIPHHQAVRLFEATQAWFHFGPDDVWTMFHSHAFDFSVWEIWGALLHGGRLVIVPFALSRAPDAFLQLLERERVTVLNQTPSAFRQLMAADEAAPADLALRTIVFGGEALDVAGLRPWFERRGDQTPRLINMYGITETTVHVTYRPIGLADCAEGRSVIGVPIPDLQLHVLDRCLQPAPFGVAGEIFVGGAGVARGYLKRPELTAERFVPDPFSGRPGAALYRSGDLARRLPNGDLEYLGRIDHQVKIRGFRVELGEIESALSAHPDVRAALVLFEDGRLIAYAVGRRPLQAAELREHLKRRLPDYMVPAALLPLEAFPLTAHGKVDRRALPKPDAATGVAAGFAAPRPGTEELIAGHWRELLGLERVGREDSFFDLGGNSLLAVQVHRRLRAALGREFSVVALFQHATIAALAAWLEAGPAVADPGLEEARERARRRQDARRARGGEAG